MNPSPIDFEPLKTDNLFNIKIPPLDRAFDWMPWHIANFFKIICFLLILPTFLFFTITVFIILLFLFKNETMTLIVISVLGLIFSIFARRSYVRSQRRKSNAIEKFARHNGWKYGLAKSIIRDFRHGTETKSADQNDAKLYSISGIYKNHDFELLLAWRAGSYDSFEPLTPQLFIHTKKILPDCVLVSRDATEGAKIFDKMYLGYKNPQPVSLEGDFDKYFQLYVPEGQHINALSFVAPDFMETIKNFSSKFIIELSGNTFSLLPQSTEISGQIIKDLFIAADKIFTETDY